MDHAEILYNNNHSKINEILHRHGYPLSYKGMIQAHKEKGIRFLGELHNHISQFDDADGKGWAKFKNIFNKASGVLDKVNKGSKVANSFLNPGEGSDSRSQQPAPEPKKETWKPNLYVWGGVAGGVILILILIYIFKK